ncbi:MAG: thiol-disulfide oxidoreductase DCC family protein [Comamonas sp.]
MRTTQFPLTVYYDAGCRFCNAEMTNLMLRNVQERLRFVNCAEPGFAGGPAPRDELMRAIHGVDAQGQVFIGVECLSRAYQGVGLPWVHSLVNLPVLRPLLQRLYPVVARNRYRLPQWPIALVFEVAARRAAERAARRAERCAQGRCDMDDGNT